MWVHVYKILMLGSFLMYLHHCVERFRVSAHNYTDFIQWDLSFSEYTSQNKTLLEMCMTLSHSLFLFLNPTYRPNGLPPKCLILLIITIEQSSCSDLEYI